MPPSAPCPGSTPHRSVLAFGAAAFAISWAIEIPLALQARGVARLGLPEALHYLASFGPALAAVAVANIESRGALRRLLRRLTRWRVAPSYALFAVGAPVALFVLAGLSAVVFGEAPNLARFGEVDGLPNLGALGALTLWLATFGVGEELGWRGFALPRLQASLTAWRATLVLGVAWAAWHLPAFFYRPTYRAMGPAGFVAFSVSILAASVVFTWLFNATDGSVLIVAVFHGLFDFLSVTPAGSDVTPVLMSALVVACALILARRYGPGTLAPGDRVVEPTAT
jgi:membrane protease YdiL (CAAX protease family)